MTRAMGRRTSRKIRISQLPPIFLALATLRGGGGSVAGSYDQTKKVNALVSAAAVDWSHRLYVATDRRRRQSSSRTCNLCVT